MPIVFSARSDDPNFYPRVGTGRSVAYTSNTPTQNADAAFIGGYRYTCTTTKFIMYNAFRASPGTRNISFLLRGSPQYTGAPVATKGICFIGADGALGHYVGLRHNVTTGNLQISANNENRASCLANGAAWSPTSGTLYDVGFSWTGDTTANGAKLYVDGVLLWQATATAALSASVSNEWWKAIYLGNGPQQVQNCDWHFNELVYWNEIIDFTSASNKLESGTGTFNGAARTSFAAETAGVTLPAYDAGSATGGSTHSSSYSWSN